jgi:hypothetical protein
MSAPDWRIWLDDEKPGRTMTGSDSKSADVGGSHWRVILGASAGTVFEWYDFYLYGSLATFITQHFFSGVNETTGYIFALLAFAAGFAVRPLGRWYSAGWATCGAARTPSW